jgi:hypothetical protein
MLAFGYASGAVGHSLVGVGIAAVLVGGGFAFMHSTLQTWATEVVPEARATVISLFAAALGAVPLGLFAALARRRYAGA